jgi:hypothetical protein
MKTTIYQNSKLYFLKQAFSKIFPSYETTSYIQPYERNIEVIHSGHTVTYFLWTFIIIFSSIAIAVIIAELFFFK